MADEKKYVSGFRFFERKDNQPDFVLGEMLLTPLDLLAWANDNKDKCSEYNSKVQIKMQVLKSKDGKVYCKLNDYKPKGESKSQEPAEDLPF